MLVVSVGLTLGVVEIGVRVLGLAPPPTPPGRGGELRSVLEFDPVLETRYRPEATTTVRSPRGEFEIEYRFNELGLRDRPLSEDGLTRILPLATHLSRAGVSTQTQPSSAMPRLRFRGFVWSTRVPQGTAQFSQPSCCVSCCQRFGPLRSASF